MPSRSHSDWEIGSGDSGPTMMNPPAKPPKLLKENMQPSQSYFETSGNKGDYLPSFDPSFQVFLDQKHKKSSRNSLRGSSQIRERAGEAATLSGNEDATSSGYATSGGRVATSSGDVATSGETGPRSDFPSGASQSRDSSRSSPQSREAKGSQSRSIGNANAALARLVAIAESEKNSSQNPKITPRSSSQYNFSQPNNSSIHNGSSQSYSVSQINSFAQLKIPRCKTLTPPRGNVDPTGSTSDCIWQAGRAEVPPAIAAVTEGSPMQFVPYSASQSVRKNLGISPLTPSLHLPSSNVSHPSIKSPSRGQATTPGKPTTPVPDTKAESKANPSGAATEGGGSSSSSSSASKNVNAKAEIARDGKQSTKRRDSNLKKSQSPQQVSPKQKAKQEKKLSAKSGEEKKAPLKSPKCKSPKSEPKKALQGEKKAPLKSSEAKKAPLRAPKHRPEVKFPTDLPEKRWNMKDFLRKQKEEKEEKIRQRKADLSEKQGYEPPQKKRDTKKGNTAEKKPVSMNPTERKPISTTEIPVSKEDSDLLGTTTKDRLDERTANDVLGGDQKNAELKRGRCISDDTIDAIRMSSGPGFSKESVASSSDTQPASSSTATQQPRSETVDNQLKGGVQNLLEEATDSKRRRISDAGKRGFGDSEDGIGVLLTVSPSKFRIGKASSSTGSMGRSTGKRKRDDIRESDVARESKVRSEGKRKPAGKTQCEGSELDTASLPLDPPSQNAQKETLLPPHEQILLPIKKALRFTTTTGSNSTTTGSNNTTTGSSDSAMGHLGAQIASVEAFILFSDLASPAGSGHSSGLPTKRVPLVTKNKRSSPKRSPGKHTTSSTPRRPESPLVTEKGIGVISIEPYGQFPTRVKSPTLSQNSLDPVNIEGYEHAFGRNANESIFPNSRNPSPSLGRSTTKPVDIQGVIVASPPKRLRFEKMPEVFISPARIPAAQNPTTEVSTTQTSPNLGSSYRESMMTQTSPNIGFPDDDEDEDGESLKIEFSENYDPESLAPVFSPDELADFRWEHKGKKYKLPEDAVLHAGSTPAGPTPTRNSSKCLFSIGEYIQTKNVEQGVVLRLIYETKEGCLIVTKKEPQFVQVIIMCERREKKKALQSAERYRVVVYPAHSTFIRPSTVITTDHKRLVEIVFEKTRRGLSLRQFYSDGLDDQAKTFLFKCQSMYAFKDHILWRQWWPQKVLLQQTPQTAPAKVSEEQKPTESAQ